MPRLSRTWPLSVPLTLPFELPRLGFPFRWTVLPWLPGDAAFTGPLDQAKATLAIAEFLKLRQAQPQPEGAPLRGKADRLDLRFADLRHWIGQFQGEADPLALAKVAARMRKLPPHSDPVVRVHGDLHTLILLSLRARLSAVIDWGRLGMGDPAIDLMIGWTQFDAPAREVFRQAMAPAPDAWDRAGALAFAKAVAEIPDYRRANPEFRAMMLATLARVLQDET
ncbi:MAG: phosphotransferase [Cypionkella sp.]